MSLPIRQRNADAPSARSQSISNQNHIAQAADVRKETETTAHVATGEEKLVSESYSKVDLGTSAHPGALALVRRVIRGSRPDTRIRVTPECGTRVRHPLAGVSHTRVSCHSCMVAGVPVYTRILHLTRGHFMPRRHPLAIAGGASAGYEDVRKRWGRGRVEVVELAHEVDTYNKIVSESQQRLQTPQISKGNKKNARKSTTSPADDVAAQIPAPALQARCSVWRTASPPCSMRAPTVSRAPIVLLPRLRGLTHLTGVFPWRQLAVVLHLYGADSESSARVFIADSKSSDGTSVVVVVAEREKNGPIARLRVASALGPSRRIWKK
ncbi:hypothetical protein BDZ89DRAFT_1257725 [Hymenopellis radicata]|nr:hypothetical protein BDZ89DRAFT_1257725 [Hymenopellis radicata]